MITIRRILCPVDFSDPSRHALEQARRMARWSGARLTVLHAHSPWLLPMPALRSPADREGAGEVGDLRERLVSFLEASIGGDVDIETRVVSGHATAAITEQAALLQADLIVMGTHGTSGVDRLLLGSVTEKVLRKAACPVMTVPPRAASGLATPFRRVLCPIDFSTPSVAALEFARSIAESATAGLVVLHVIEWPWHEPPAPVFDELPPEQGAALAEYRRYLETLATNRLRELVPDAVGAAGSPETMIRHGKPYVEILRVAAEHDVDLVVIGVHGRNVADRALFGSTTNHVVRQAVCPVMTIRH